MKILIIGAGKMGRFFADVLSFHHEVCLYDTDPKQLRFVYNAIRTTDLEEVRAFEPELMINAVTIKYTIEAFKNVIPYLPKNCILSDIASVKTGLKKFYAKSGFRFVSSHPMFGPTFASLSDLSTQSAIIISESDALGKAFFKDIYGSLKLSIFEYTFEKHDQTTAYSLSIPFASTLVFGSVMRHQEAPGTTFKRHMTIAQGLMSEDDYLLQEILFNPFATEQIENIMGKLKELHDIIKEKDAEKMQAFLKTVRKNIS
ncbi:MAG: prephenate dehydrogenase/arogenate dehydrogenase family protein [Bacteroidales bacterium]|nr:prephenate dehydrogenase/arogenate dehydrogenase family protein [Bacteroidales bacterium]